MFRKAADLMLAEDYFVVDLDVKDAAGSFNEFALHADGFLNVCCQTGSLSCVVSHHAVGDSDFHHCLLKSYCHRNSKIEAVRLKVILRYEQQTCGPVVWR